ncbi:hypothetical protein DFH94DRAFT_820523 [Russula ochroleuca]|uniref:Uncharacterized protein n=1 Tax=Russula ochroleuca TaxID=152965 RepID=A0A9P5N1Q3_9AGAM|nr:hypothetical protein DFH94DRAFT_820523 [Russula ochroleuca]
MLPESCSDTAKSVTRFISEHHERPMEEDGDPASLVGPRRIEDNVQSMEDDEDPAWFVGPRMIEDNDLVLVRLDHVSKGSWQASLQPLRPLRPR